MTYFTSQKDSESSKQIVVVLCIINLQLFTKIPFFFSWHLLPNTKQNNRLYA